MSWYKIIILLYNCIQSGNPPCKENRKSRSSPTSERRQELVWFLCVEALPIDALIGCPAIDNLNLNAHITESKFLTLKEPFGQRPG